MLRITVHEHHGHASPGRQIQRLQQLLGQALRIGDKDGLICLPVGTVTFRLVLEPYQSVFVVPEAAGEAGGFAEMGATGETGALNRAELSGKSGERPIPLVDEAFVAARREKRLEGAWRISVLRETGEYEALNGLTELTNISAADILPEYSGRICLPRRLPAPRKRTGMAPIPAEMSPCRPRRRSQSPPEEDIGHPP